MSRATKPIVKSELTREERRARRELRREKQRKDNIGRAAKMHAARLKMRSEAREPLSDLKASAYVGCSGWFYWKWRGLFYPSDLPTSDWLVATPSASTPSKSTLHFIRGQPLQM